MRILRWFTATAVAVVLCIPPVPLHAFQYSDVELITVSNTSKGLTSSKINATSGHAQADSGSCTVTGDALAYRYNGSATTSDQTLQVNQTLSISGNDYLNAFQAIRITTDSTLRCNYFSKN